LTVEVIKAGKPRRAVTCPVCGTRFTHEYKAGKKFDCPTCGSVLRWTEEEGE